MTSVNKRRWLVRNFVRLLRLPLSVLLSALCVASCDAGGLPQGWLETPVGEGPAIVWDLNADPLPEIPLPNDVATWADPTSPTGLRINVSLIAPTGMESRLRAQFDRLDGWGTFAPLSVRFDAPIDTGELIARQGRDRFSAEAFRNHAIYLVDLETGVPVPLDINSERFPRSAADPDDYYPHDPRAGESNLLFETVDEDLNGNGVLDLGEDTDFDGILDAPNTIDGQLTGERYETIDNMLWFYERATNTLLIRPIIPLESRRRYAVVLTDRLVGVDGAPVRSPFRHVHHAAQREALEGLDTHFRTRPHIYGDLAERGWEGVAFAWSFTTQSVGYDLGALREGLYGRGPFARLHDEFDPTLVPVPLIGGTRTAPCDPGPRVYTTTPEQLAQALEGLPVEGLGFPAAQLQDVLESLERSVSHISLAYFESPYLLGDPEAETVDDTWDLDATTGEARIAREWVPALIIVPKETETHRQPFRTTLYSHGYGSLNLEAVAFAGLVANHGVATVSINSQGHGIPLGDALLPLLEAVLGANCLAPLGRAAPVDRARDLNGDNIDDSGGLFFSAYMFHTRDALRQTVVDWMQMVRIIRTWDGHPDWPEGRDWTATQVPAGEDAEPFDFNGDMDGDGVIDRAGDFDGDGVVDIGGYDMPFGQWGSSLGGIVSMINAGVEPTIDTAAPVSGGGGLFDIGVRTSLGTAQHPIWLRLLGPLITSSTSGGPSDSTGCAEGSRSLRFQLPDLNDRTDTELGCVEAADLGEGDVVLLHNLTNGETHCTGVLSDGRFRVAVPSDVNDELVIEIYDDAIAQTDFETCAFEGERPTLNTIVDTWGSANERRESIGACPECAFYQGRVFELGSPLVAPAEGLALQRQSSDLRRLAGLAQIALEPADPINYARRVFLDPVQAVDVPERTRSVMIMSTAGDTTVPVSGGNAYARAAGVLAFLPPDAPDELADYRAPFRFQETYGAPTPDDVLIDRHVIEGLASLERHPAPGAPEFLFDVDDLSDGQHFFSPDGRSQLARSEGGVPPNRLDPPLRWGRESRRVIDGSGDPWTTDGYEGHSVVLNAMTAPRGQHVLLPVDGSKNFDESEYLLNVIGWYLASHGSELPWNVLEDPFCLESSSCSY